MATDTAGDGAVSAKARGLLALDHFDLMGGAQACLLDQLAELGRRGRSIAVTRAWDARVEERLRGIRGLRRLPVFPYLTRRSLTPGRFLDFFRLRRQTAVFGCLLANSLPALLTGAMLKRRGQSLLFQCHRIDLNLLQRVLLRVSAPDCVLSVSTTSHDYLLGLGLPSGRVHLVGNGFALDDFPELPLSGADPAKPIRVGLVARLHREKGVEEFISLARDLADNDGLSFTLVGPLVDPVLLPVIEHARQAGWVEIKDYVEKPADIYQDLDLVLSMSRFLESFGRTVVEAALMGRPAIVLLKGHTPQLIEHGRTGYVVRDLAELADQLTSLAGDRERLAELGAAARSVAVARHDLRVTVDRLEDCVTSCQSN